MQECRPFSWRFFGIPLTIIPQIAIWVEDLHGNYIETLYIAKLSGKSSWRGLPFAKKEVRRPAALPYWSHKRGVLNEDGLYMPTKETPLPDTITGATPKGSFSLKSHVPEELDGFVVLLEINKSFDYNKAYSKALLEDDSKNHAEKSYSGQPALVYAAKITPGFLRNIRPCSLSVTAIRPEKPDSYFRIHRSWTALYRW